ncbi:cryptochrome/photolyase family protein [Bdellovibrio sp. HCB337]|uniref:cryptochrome/photolyase family protein n=1 Tax=Bdellovibrio sp. HCB337 TaxID=3394358 RepID=UPI0039A6834F
MATSKSLFLLQEDHLFPPTYLEDHKDDLFLMMEDKERLSSFKFHKHRLVFYLAAMRHYARELKHHDFNLVYFELDETRRLSCESILEKVLKEGDIEKVVTFEIEDKTQEKSLQDFCEKNGYALEVKPSPLFITSRQGFKSYLEQYSRPSVKTFYENQRRKLGILMEPNGEPSGGQFSFSDEDRLKWTKKNSTPKFPVSVRNELDMQVIQLVDKEFGDNHGDAHTFWYPTTREAAHDALKDFCTYRLAEYGPYEDTLCPDEDFLFHSVLAPLLNIGLLTPQEVIKTALGHSLENPVSLNSLESFVRKILGYREYVRGIYQNFNEFQEQSNFWKHVRLPNQNWYLGKTQIPPLDDAIQKSLRLAYNHHVERLKIVCNMMNLAEINPYEVYRWFMEMQMDSTAWALGPNVYGMGLHSDGGIFANNLHICGSNYWLKISTYKKGDWCHEVDGLYWRFIDKHQDFFAKNPRLSVMTSNLERMSSERKELLWKAADAFLARNTSYP